MVHIRRDIWCLESATTWDPISLDYAEAVADMQGRAATDPTSWTYQAGIHGSYNPPPPGAAWNQCQHASWFFLSWHRMYLYWFERIVRSTVIKLKGNSHKHWALPYWNYSKGFPSNTLPPAFRQPTLPGGAANPLYVADPGRNTNPTPGINGGAQIPPGATSFAAAFADTNFLPPFPCFGGGQSPPVHFGSATGDLENVPHNVIHVLVGGSGLMGDPNRAALDPIFWLHHSNIDRLWSHWLESGGGRADPSDSQWLTQQFTFYDESGAAVTMRSQDVIHTVAQLKYRYEDEPPPAVYHPFVIHPERHPVVPVPLEHVLAASEKPVELAGPAEVSLRLTDENWQTLRELDPDVSIAPSVQLWLEGIEFTENPGVIYEIYLNLTNEADEEERFAHLVGFVTFFGGTHHHGQMAHGQESPGMTEVFNLTNLIFRAKETREFEERRLDFKFLPLGLLPPPEQGVTGPTTVKPAAKATIRRLRVTSRAAEPTR